MYSSSCATPSRCCRPADYPPPMHMHVLVAACVLGQCAHVPHAASAQRMAVATAAGVCAYGCTVALLLLCYGCTIALLLVAGVPRARSRGVRAEQHSPRALCITLLPRCAAVVVVAVVAANILEY
eukprot:scaffold117870_cov57-Phaeocystis_antarctica.AAC.2